MFILVTFLVMVRVLFIRFFCQWEIFVDLEKAQRKNQRRAEEFRRYLCNSFSDLLNFHNVIFISA